MEKRGIKLKCPHCHYIWVYRGAKKVHATCPDCMRKIKTDGNAAPK
jgi:uncharacterized protein (DUF983 family)